jgi:hypothetical protein
MKGVAALGSLEPAHLSKSIVHERILFQTREVREFSGVRSACPARRSFLLRP